MELEKETRALYISSQLHYLTHLNMLLFPAVVMPCSRELGIPPGEVISLSLAMYFLYGALALPAGFLADRWSKISILKVCAAGMSISSILAGMSNSKASLALSLSLLGFFCSLYHPAGLGLIASHAGKQGRAHGFNGVMGNLGIMSAPLLAGVILMMANWRYVYLIAGILGMIGFGLVSALGFKEKEARGRKSNAMDGSRSSRIMYFAILCAAMTTAGFVYRANTLALPSLFETAGGGIVEDMVSAVASSMGKDAGSGAAAIIVSSLMLFSIIGQTIGGKVADSYDLRYGYLAFHAMTVPFIIGMSLLSGAGLYAAAAGMVFFNLGVLPIENSLVSKFIPSRWISTGYGIKFTLTFGVGSLAVAQVAYIQENLGIKSLYPFLAGEAAFAAAMALVLLAVTRAIPKLHNARDEAKKPV